MILYHVIETSTGKVCIIESKAQIALTLIVNGERADTIVLTASDMRSVMATLQEILGHIENNKDSA